MMDETDRIFVFGMLIHTFGMGLLFGNLVTPIIRIIAGVAFALGGVLILGIAPLKMRKLNKEEIDDV